MPGVSSTLAERLTGGVSSITLVEMAAEFGVIMLLYLKNARTEREDAGDSSEVTSRITAPMIGGMLRSPLLSLFVLPVAYRMMHYRWRSGDVHRRLPIREDGIGRR